MERLFQYIWQHGLWGGPDSVLDDGRVVKIINPGTLNRDAGPDFFNARILIDGVCWIGNIELHEASSQWYTHNHDNNPNYDNIILHVTGKTDCQIFRSDGTPIPQLEIVCPKICKVNYEWLEHGPAVIRCRRYLNHLDRIVLTDWLESLACARIMRKGRLFSEWSSTLNHDMRHAAFILLARAMGFGLNADPMEQLARSLPPGITGRHSDNLLQLEALLFGQAGLLDSSTRIFDEYYQQLCREYSFLAHKYSLRPMRDTAWKMARTRPSNFPHLRIAMLARFLYGGFSLTGDIISASSDIDKIRSLLNPRIDGFWATHYSFDAVASRGHEGLSRSSQDLLIINYCVPLVAEYAQERNDAELLERTHDLLRSLPPENNRIIRAWDEAGIQAESALDSQAMIELQKEYCDKRRCLSCRWGYQVLSNTTEYVADPIPDYTP